MINKTTNTLLVFDNFFKDLTLPKFKKDKKDITSLTGDFDSLTVPTVSSGFEDDGWLTNSGGIIRHNPEDESWWDGISINVKDAYLKQQIIKYYEYLSGSKKLKTKRLFKRVLFFFLKKYINKKFKINSGSIEDFFINVKQSPEEISVSDKRLKSYKQYLLKAEKTGQKALVEKIKSMIYTAGKESVMLSIGINKFLTEKQVIEFTKKTEKGLRMDWIKNYIRNIPDNILIKKEKCDNYEIFDNYVILHYDPNKKAIELTEKEKERKKDPVLFGLLKGSRNLYYIGDWEDEFCTLTLKELLQTIDNEAFIITEEFKSPNNETNYNNKR